MNFPLGFYDIGLWLAMTSIILLATSELLNRSYGETNLRVDTVRLRNAAKILGIIFLITVSIRVFMIIFKL